MSDTTLQTYQLFAEDSNIWIEAQKHAASGNSYLPMLTDRDRDPRLRIDIGQLIQRLCGSRNRGGLFLYGSHPPPNDTVWEAFKRNDFKTKIFDRSYGGKEKQVDGSMGTDIARIATELRIGAQYNPDVKAELESTVFIVITGDRDLMPSIELVLNCKIHVELWAWRDGISKEYLKLDAKNGQLSVNLLDDAFGEIFYLNFLSTRRSNRVCPDKALILVVDDGIRNVVRFVSGELLSLSRLFYLYPPQDEAPYVVVEFPEIRATSDLESIIQNVRVIFEDTCSVVSWPEYMSRNNNSAPCVIETSNVYQPLRPTESPAGGLVSPTNRLPRANTMRGAAPGDRPAQDVEQQDGSQGPGDSQPWQTVTRSTPNSDHRRAMRNSQRCSKAIRCNMKGECGYKHTDHERSLFREYPNHDFRMWKSGSLREVGKSDIVVQLLRHLSHNRDDNVPIAHATSGCVLADWSRFARLGIDGNLGGEDIRVLKARLIRDPRTPCQLGIVLWYECPGEIRFSPSREPAYDDLWDYTNDDLVRAP
ncbi:unnamed protein product [Parascedosporium putredinis]|uniref:NYN domain-containing protein n=1 Tax=Parascedosporium putredinis TaxID=1442378 RepID=A0A9P1GX76_9PEZI|nr:unnamed protein product [Parascedosporium putredinis]CAI7988926.1 unnamed protein product [Parascedosporium putredinis]